MIQGQLGDCWFLSALAVLGAQDNLLDLCFYRGNDFQEYGLFVLRFFKDCNVIYLIVDDRLPVKAKDGRLIFAANKDPNELWVPLIEKAYAKLHGCYKSLIGGYTHYGLADMTGFCPRLLVMRDGYLGYSEPYSDEDIWLILQRYLSWNSLMGCSIQSNPKEKNKVEADAGQGLHFGHAYSFLGIGEINVDKKISASGKMRLVKLRNPWGRGEWEGRFNDRSPERETYNTEIEKAFNVGKEQEKVQQNFNDGTFLMPFDDWRKYYTSLFVAINFPRTWCGKRAQGNWSSEQGGNRDMGTWITNPKFKLRLEGTEGCRQVFVGIYIKDSRLTLGYDYYKDPLYATPLTFDIVTEAELKDPDPKRRECIPMGFRSEIAGKWQGQVRQAPYNFGTTQIEVYLQVGVDYYIVPSLYKRHQAGTFFLNVFGNVSDFHLDGSTVVNEAHKPMIVGPPAAVAALTAATATTGPSTGTASAVPLPKGTEVLKMSVSQFYERKEALRERIISEASRLNLSVNQLQAIFKDCKERMSRSAFKRRMMEVGFMLTDFPDDDLVVLDKDNDGTISPQEFMSFYEEGLHFNDPTVAGPPPEAPVDDLLLKSIDLSGQLTVKVFSARDVRQAATWFAVEQPTNTTRPGLIKYDPVEAKAVRLKANKDRLHPVTKPTATSALALSAPTGDQNANIPSPGSSPVRPAPLPSRHTPSKSGGLGSLRLALSEGVANSVVSGISLTQKEAVQQAGAAAASKLHSDASLKKAELNRTKHLPLLRSYASKQKEASATSSDKKSSSNAVESVLRRQTSTQAVKRDIAEDLDALRLLSYAPSGDSNAVPRATAPAPSTPFKPAVSMRMPKNFSVKSSAINFLVAPSGDQSAVPPIDAAASAAAAHSVIDKQYDLWDYLIDCVVTISMSRPRNHAVEKQAQFAKMRRQPLSTQQLAQLNPVKSPLPVPLVNQTPSKVTKGTVVTPKSMRRATGVASVNTVQSKTQQKGAVLEAKDRLALIQKEQGNRYEEVYRRLVAMPVTTHEEICGERNNGNASLSSRSTVYIRNLFAKFDRNLNGLVSKDEFRLALQEVNIEVSTEDCDIFFNRFRGRNGGNIDWKDFLEFFELHIVGGTNSLANKGTAANQGLVAQITEMKGVLYQVLLEMVASGVNSIEKLNEMAHSALQGRNTELTHLSPRRQASVLNKITFPDNAIFQSLELSQTKTNTALLQSLGLSLTVSDMARISRIFAFNVALLMEFIRAPEVDLFEALDCIDVEINKEFSMRSGMPLAQRAPIPAPTAAAPTIPAPPPPAGGPDPSLVQGSASATLKIWNSIASDTNATVPYEAFVKFLGSTLQGGGSNAATPALPVTTAPAAASAAAAAVPGRVSKFLQGVNMEVLQRIVADTLVYSTWNRGQQEKADKQDDSTKLIPVLSFSGLDAYMRSARMNFIERKLQYLMQLESNISSPTVHLLVHVYVSTKGDELVILGHDPLTAEVCKLSMPVDVKALPYGDQVKAMICEFKDWGAERNSKSFNPDSLYLYNPIDTPAEDQAIAEVISRCKIVRGKNGNEILLTEDPKLVKQLKTLLDASGNILPFFSLVNDLNLSFEVDEEHLRAVEGKKTPSLRSVVFSSLRNYQPLYAFLTQVRSSLKVVLSTYNSSARETFSWEEMLGHLTNYRNPFLTVTLLPKYIPPEAYLYEPHEDKEAFTGEDEQETNWQRGPVDVDGAPHPTWNHQFAFAFQAPKLTACNVLCTEVVKQRIDDVWKYVMVMVRQGRRVKATSKGSSGNTETDKEDFLFLTIYDPRSATEYQCGVKPTCSLYKMLYYHKINGPKPMFEAKEMLNLIGEAGDKEMLLLGPAITPRLEVQVYNDTDKTKELLGQCQVSISSVLSGSGVGDKAWVTLIHRQDKQANGGKAAVDLRAGEVQMELSFRRSIEIEAEQQAAEEKEQQTIERKMSRERKASLSYATTTASSIPSKPKGTVENKDLQGSYDTLLTEYRKLKEQKLLADDAGKSADRAEEAVPVDILQKERDDAVKEAAKAKKEKEAMEAVLKKWQNEMKQKDAKPEDNAANKLLQQLEEMRKQNAQLKAAEELAKKQLQELLSQQAEATQALPTAGAKDANANAVNAPAVVAPVAPTIQVAAPSAPVVSPVVPAAPPAASGAAGPATISVTAPSVVASAPSTAAVTVLAMPNALAGEVVLPRGNFPEAIHQLLTCLLARHDRKASKTDKPGAALEGLNNLLNSYANVEGLVSYKDVVNACADLLIDMDTETAVRLLQELGPNARRLVQVHAIIDFLTRELAQLAKNAKKGPTPSRPTASAEPGVMMSDDAYALAIQQLMTILQARYEHKGKAVMTSSAQASVPLHLEALQRLLTSYASAEGLIASKDIVAAGDELLLDVLDDSVAARIVHESGPNLRKLVTVPAVIGYLSKELLALLRSKQPPVSADKRNASPTKVRPASANPTPTARKSKTSALKPAARVVVSRDDTAGANEGKRIAAELRKPEDGVKDWSTEPLPPQWERRFHAPSNRVGHVQCTLIALLTNDVLCSMFTSTTARRRLSGTIRWRWI